MAIAGDGNTIDLTTLACSTISLTTGALSTTADNLTIDGPGRDALTIDAGYSDAFYNNAIYHFGTGTIAIEGVTIRDAKYAGDFPYGGCIYSEGSILLRNATISSCTLYTTSLNAVRGGAIYAKGAVAAEYSTIAGSLAASFTSRAFGGAIDALGVTLRHATLDGNVAYSTEFGVGGGAFSRGGATIDASTISANTASHNIGGLVANGSGTYATDILNSTISGNSAGNVIGGLASVSTMTVRNSTIAFNVAEASDCSNYGYAECGAGLQAVGAATLQSTIVANNIAGASPLDVGVGSAGTIGGADNLVPASATPLPADTLAADPLLSPLADNGGATRTHALADGSPAIDAGSNGAGAQSDQRGAGFARVAGAAVDIGAFERQGPGDGDVLFVGGFDP